MMQTKTTQIKERPILFSGPMVRAIADRCIVEHLNSRVEDFLNRNSGEITRHSRAKAREAAAKAIHDENQPICTSHVPAHLRDEFRRIIIEAAYRHRNKGKIFDAKAVMLKPDRTDYSTIVINARF